MTNLARSPRLAAGALLVAAALGLLAANGPWADTFLHLRDFPLALPAPFDLSIGHWVSDGLLAVFFFVVALELVHEFTRGHLSTRAAALRPALATAGGVIVPALVYLAIAGRGPFAAGWPIPTATDIAFALGVLAVFGRHIHPRLRAFILALATLDDLAAIVVIAIVFTDQIAWVGLAVAAPGAAAYAVLLRRRSHRLATAGPHSRLWRVATGGAIGLLACLTWAGFLASGVHATLAGVLLGALTPVSVGNAVRHRLEPWVNAAILPLYAFTAALVVVPHVAAGSLTPAFWGVLLALPGGKLLGIVAGGWLSQFIGRGPRELPLPGRELVAAGLLGGVGFTVSLLLASLAFADMPEVADESTVAVLLASVLSMVAAAIAVARLDRAGRNALATPPPAAVSRASE